MNEIINDTSSPETPSEKSERATRVLSRVALFLGELRDGLTMINMQNAFLITSKHYTEKQAGVMFFVFGMSQFLFQTPAGYLMDYTERKVQLLSAAAVFTTILTLSTAVFAQDNGGNLISMVVIKFLQGAITALIPPGLNSITQGIVGAEGMTKQVSKNEMMNHLGTAIIVLAGSLLAYGLYPDIGMLFIVSPIACLGVICYMCQIREGDIDHNAARGLTTTTADEKQLPSKTNSFNYTSFAENGSSDAPQENSTLEILRDPTLLAFIIVCFCFHMSNGTVLPLVMQTVAIENGNTGILMSGLCIIIAQFFMVLSAKICGDYSGVYGRKTLFLIGLFSVPLRCALLTFLLHIKESAVVDEYYDAYYEEANGGQNFIDILILSTQILDGVGAGIFGTMYVLVTSDISGGTGRFSLTLGLTTAAMSIGGTVSGYLGQALAQDRGYREAFIILGFMALIPALLYLFIVPETLATKGSEKEKGSNASKSSLKEII